MSTHNKNIYDKPDGNVTTPEFIDYLHSLNLNKNESSNVVWEFEQTINGQTETREVIVSNFTYNNNPGSPKTFQFTLLQADQIQIDKYLGN